MSVLVTGGAGYIGSHMVWELLDAGEKVVVLDRLSSGFDWAVPPEAPLVVGDVGDSELVGSIIREHSGRRDHPFRRFDRWSRNRSPTRSATTKTTPARPETWSPRLCGRGVPHFIFSSTAAVYGTAGIEPVREDATTGAGIALRHCPS